MNTCCEKLANKFILILELGVFFIVANIIMMIIIYH